MRNRCTLCETRYHEAPVALEVLRLRERAAGGRPVAYALDARDHQPCAHTSDHSGGSGASAHPAAQSSASGPALSARAPPRRPSPAPSSASPSRRSIAPAPCERTNARVSGYRERRGATDGRAQRDRHFRAVRRHADLLSVRKLRHCCCTRTMRTRARSEAVLPKKSPCA